MEYAPFIGDGSPTPTRIARLSPMSRMEAVETAQRGLSHTGSSKLDLDDVLVRVSQESVGDLV
jgi:hypothetical protein